jgi:hypothetical protein
VTPGWPSDDARAAGPGWGAPLDEPRSLRDWARYVLAAVAVLVGLVAIGFLANLVRSAGG